MKRTVSTDAAPAAVGAYSQATATDSPVFTAGQLPLILSEGIFASHSSRKPRLSTIFRPRRPSLVHVRLSDSMTPDGDSLDDIDDFEAMNEACASSFEANPPARSAVEVANLPKGVGIEIEAVATTDA